ncbi:hypothetical protein FBQ87_14925 [Sphingobacteriales bacterium CHB3]|nr:hypothetical protein [Sphingobacteriales bacterium CHB3]
MTKQRAPKVRTTSEHEYRLTIAPHFNAERQARTVLITIETTRRFASFRYELAVQEELTEKELRLTIVGLKAPQLSLPASGTAQFIREYDNLKGTYSVTVASLDGTENTFVIKFTAKNITLLKSPKQPIVELVVS